MKDKEREIDAGENTGDVGREVEAPDIGETCEPLAVVEEEEKKS